jgi:hypothetical protein
MLRSPLYRYFLAPASLCTVEYSVMNMAKRKYSKMKKIEPSVQTFTFVIPSGDAGKETNSLDLSQCASLLNRRFYRQGINWAVSSFKILSSSGVTGQISIQKLPNTWVMSNSWEKSMRAWSKMNREALSEAPSIKPKFLDFKIFMNEDHHVAGLGNNLLPLSSATLGAPVQVATKGEWESSKAVIPFASASPGNVLETEFIAVGASYPGAGASGLNAVSLIEGYAASRGLPNVVDPNTPGDADDADGSTPENWLSAMFNDGTDQDSDVIENLITEQNRPPYPYEGDSIHIDTMYPNGANQLSSLEIHDQEFITSTTIGGTTRLKGGNFPCGLIEVATFGLARDESISLQVNLVPGHHRGYLCEPMTEM